MKRILSLSLAVVMVLSLFTFAVAADDTEVTETETPEFVGTNVDSEPTQQDGSFTAAEAVKIPNTATDAIPTEGAQVWSGDVQFAETASGVTLVFAVKGVDSPIDMTKVNLYFTTGSGETKSWSTSPDLWQWNNVWGGVFCPRLNIAMDGIYYLYLNRKAIANNSDLTIKSVQGFNIFSTEGNVREDRVRTNTNENATFQMLAIVPNDLQPTVNFFDENGNLLTTQTHEYTDYGNVNVQDAVSGLTDGINDKKAKQTGALITPTALFEQAGVAAPSKASDAQYLYKLVWKDADGNIVDGVYMSQNLFADFVAVDKTAVEVTFVDAKGEKIYTKTMSKNALAYEGDAPAKAADADNTYTFAGWSVDGQTVIDLATYAIEEETLAVTFVPVYKTDLILKATLEGDAVPMGGEATYTVVLNRTDLSTDVLAGTTEPITAGEVTITYNKDMLTVAGADGTATVSFTTVAEDGTTDATVTFKAVDGMAGKSDVSLTGKVGEVEMGTTSVKVEIGGAQAGLYIENPETVVLNKNDGDKGPAPQVLWQGKAPMDNATSFSFVLKIDGIETAINASHLAIGVNNGWKTNSSWSWFWGNSEGDNWTGVPSVKYQTFEDNGYFVLYLHNRTFDGMRFTEINSLSIFANNINFPETNKPEGNGDNANENATITVLAIVGAGLAPTVTFHDADGNVIGESVTQVYVDEAKLNTNSGSEVKQLVELETPEALFATVADTNPGKLSDIAKVTYEFDGWMDAKGNKVEAVYMSGDLYPSYKVVDNRSKYTVEFVNADDAKTVLQSSEVPEDVLPEYTGETPKLPSTETNSYVFKGWDKEIVKTPVTDKYDGALIEEKIVYTATFEEVERRYDVTYYDEDGETKLGEVLNIVRGQAANFEVVPTKDADVQNTYTFEKWVAMDGSDVDLTRVEADLSVKAKYTATLNKYTVTFMSEDKSEQIATSTVDYGTAAQAPEVTKDPVPEKHIAYEFDAWVDAEGNAVDVTNVTGDVTVYATFKNVLTHEFTDLNESAWYMGAVKYALQNGLMSGMNNTTFAPDATMTRAQFATVLYRMEGEPDVSEMDDPTLPDYNPDAWWADAFKWANNVGIINGSNINGVDLLDPDGTVTRLQIATMLYRYADNVFLANDGSVGLDMTELDKLPPTSLADFQDKNDINYSTKEARWAYNREYITGMTKVEGEKPYFAPSDGASRAQVITILMRFLEDTENHVPKGTIVVEH